MPGYAGRQPLNSGASNTHSKRQTQSRRHWLTVEPKYAFIVACFFATFVAYVERVGFSIAYTEMAKLATVDEAVKGTVLSAFFWGYAISQVPGGWAAQRWGGRIMLSTSFALWSTASVLTPSTAKSTRAIMAARVCVGVAQGFLIPSVHTVLSLCIPAAERARAVSLTTSGMYLGSAGAMLFLPTVAGAFGGHVLMRLNGALGLLWLLAWVPLSRRMPSRVNGMPVVGTNHGNGGKVKAPRTPWARMLSHPAVWAIVINNFTFHYAFYVVMNWLPTYFDTVLKVSLAGLGPVKTLPYLVMFVMSNVGNLFGDWLITRRRWPVAAARKAVNTVGFWGAAVALLLMPRASSVSAGVAITSVVLGFLGCARGGFSVNHMDIAPTLAGVLMGISNTAGTLAGVIGVSSSGWLLQQAGGATSLKGWYNALGLSSALCLLGSGVFLRCARGSRIFGENEDSL